MVQQRVKVGRHSSGENKMDVSEPSKSRVIRAIQESTSHKLASINMLLQTVVQSAKTVVKGTDSQRRFNAQFSEFCRASLVGIADLEDAVYMIEKSEGIVGNESYHEEGGKGIGVTDFIKEIAAFIASQTSALGAQYLEHVGLSAVTAASKTQSKPAETKRTTKRGRTDDTKQPRELPDRVSSPRKRMETLSPSINPSWEPDGPSSSPSLPANKSGRGRGAATEAQHGAVKLTSIPELSTWLQPWNLPLPNAHGVALDRVVTERPKTSASPEVNSKHSEEVLVSDICTALTTSEVLRLWEARECLLSASGNRTNTSNPVPTETVLSSDVETTRPMFFPRRELGVRALVSTQVMVDLVHYGISSLEVPFKDVVLHGS